MSSVYVLEPPTRGKVLLNTTAGPLDFEFWPKEAPKAVRNFVQLCLDSYYDGAIFHRIIKTFMVQGGDPTGTGTGRDTIYGEPFVDEFHSRLRFNRRGLVACANAGSPNSNNSQFFITLDRCDWLDKKRTIFGKVTGDTIFNLIKLGDRPLDPPPTIVSVDVLWNPFDDVVPRKVAEKSLEAPLDDATVPKKRKKARKELNLLSFGEEVKDDEQQLAIVKEKKIKSSHDVLEDPRLPKSATDAEQIDSAEAMRRQDLQISTQEALKESLKANDGSSQRHSRARSPGSGENDETSFDDRMREKIMEKKRMMHMGTEKQAGKDSKGGGKTSTSTSKSSPPRRAKSDDDYDDLARKNEKLSVKEKGLGSKARAEFVDIADLDLELLSPLEQQQMKYKQRETSLSGREESTLATLEKFADPSVVKGKMVRRSNSGKAVGTHTNKEYLRSVKHVGDELLPGIPNDITLNLITTKLPWRVLPILSSVSRCWEEAIRTKQVYEARVRANSTETLIVHAHICDGKDAIALYSTTENCCCELPPIPGLPRGILRTCQCIAVGGKLYFFGGTRAEGVLPFAGGYCARGVRSSEKYISSGQVYVLDLAGLQRKWGECARMLKPRSCFGCGVMDTKIYVFGGTSEAEPSRPSTRLCEVYDTVENSWSPMMPMIQWMGPCRRATDAPVARVENELFLYDNVLFREDSLTLGVYNPAKNEWRLVQRVWEKKLLSLVFITKGKFFMFSRSGIDIYDAEQNSWINRHANSFAVALPDDSTELNPLGISAVKDEIFLTASCITGKSLVFQSFQCKGLDSEKKEMVWQKTNCSFSTSILEVIHCAIHL